MKKESRFYRLWKFLPGAKEIADARETGLANGYVHVIRLDFAGHSYVGQDSWQAMHRWCDDHCLDTFMVALDERKIAVLYFMFRHPDDAFEFKMRWA